MNLSQLVRKNILALKPYSTARDDFKGMAQVFLDANENPFPSAFNRYPDPHQKALKEKIAELKQVRSEQIIVGNGSDEIIDLLFRAFCEPGVENVVIPQPTYGMYLVSAQINEIATRHPLLNEQFQLEPSKVLAEVDTNTKLIFLCSPNNPSGNLLNRNDIKTILNEFQGIVIVDEAYIDFSQTEGWLSELGNYSNLFVIQTLSKAWGLAGLRIGIGFGSSEIINVLSKIKPPYNVNTASQLEALAALNNTSVRDECVNTSLVEREKLQKALQTLPYVEAVFPSDANFLLVKMSDAFGCYQHLISNGIVVRDRSKVIRCEDCLRISIGTPDDNSQLLNSLKKFTADKQK